MGAHLLTLIGLHRACSDGAAAEHSSNRVPPQPNPQHCTPVTSLRDPSTESRGRMDVHMSATSSKESKDKTSPLCSLLLTAAI